jgi:hypothetical protein
VVTRTIGVLLIVVAAVPGAAGLLAQNGGAFLPRDHEAIRYSAPVTTDAVARLNQQLRRGAARLSFEKPHGYLGSLLAALQIAPSSQALVFSETSLQSSLISPAAPRAVYFNDTTAVGFVSGADTLEVAAHDPTQGTVFYQLTQKPQPTPELVRSGECLQCHLTAETRGVPGFVTMSVLPLSDNKHEYAQGWVTDHRTPIEDRWGGWYVTGAQVPSRHLGNVPVNHVPKSYVRAAVAPKLATGAGAFDTRGYLSPHSDVVALLVLNHQVHMANLLTRLGWTARIAEHDGRTKKGAASSTGIKDLAGEIVDYMLFVDEAPLPSAVQGSSSFGKEFASKGPRDGQGRSLRDFHLTNRLFRYPCSYMIYSEAFDALSAPAKRMVYERLWEVLSGKEQGPPYTRLSLTDRRAIVEILRATKKDLPPYFDRAAL